MSDECVCMYDIERSIKKHIYIYITLREKVLHPNNFGSYANLVNINL